MKTLFFTLVALGLAGSAYLLLNLRETSPRKVVVAIPREKVVAGRLGRPIEVRPELLPEKSAAADIGIPVRVIPPEHDVDLFAGDVITADQLQDIGSTTPEAAVESWLYSAVRGDVTRLSQLTRKAPRSFEAQLNELILSTSQNAANRGTFRLQRAISYGTDRVLAWIEFDSSSTAEVFLMTRTGPNGAWERDIDPRAYRR